MPHANAPPSLKGRRRLAAGIGKQTGYRWLREKFVSLGEQGYSVEAAQAELGFFTARVREWDQHRLEKVSKDRYRWSWS